MIDYLRSFFTQQPTAPLPSPVTITGIRFPADGSKPHMLSLTTTTYGVKDGPDSFWKHIPDFRDFWKTPQAWRRRDSRVFIFKDQPLSSCNGVYALFYSFDDESLPIHSLSNLPEVIYGGQQLIAGDAFFVKLQGNELGEDVGEDDRAIWIDVPSDILSMPVMKMKTYESTHATTRTLSPYTIL